MHQQQHLYTIWHKRFCIVTTTITWLLPRVGSNTTYLVDFAIYSGNVYLVPASVYCQLSALPHCHCRFCYLNGSCFWLTINQTKTTEGDEMQWLRWKTFNIVVLISVFVKSTNFFQKPFNVKKKSYKFFGLKMQKLHF